MFHFSRSASFRSRNLKPASSRLFQNFVCQLELSEYQSNGRTVKAIVSDVDGTLFNSKHELGPQTCEALRTAIAHGIPVMMATGKSRGPWVRQVRNALGFDSVGWSLNGPSVFIQGLLVCDAAGLPRFTSLLAPAIVGEMANFADLRSVTVVAYTTDDRIVARETNTQTDRLIPYGEPVPHAIGAAGMAALAAPPPADGQQAAGGVYKMILMAPEERLAALRPELEAQLGDRAALTKAMDGMLEVLPPGGSKGAGVKQALGMLGLGLGDCLAMGDGDNDIEMLQMVRQAGGVAVAVANATPRLRRVAEFLARSNDEEGAAQAIRLFAPPPPPPPPPPPLRV